MKLFFHRLFGLHIYEKIDKDNNVQFCKICGDARKIKHDCIFLNGEEREIILHNGNIRQSVDNQKCKICGRYRQFNLTTGRYV